MIGVFSKMGEIIDMRIAVTCENGQVFQHFGHTPEFAVFVTDGSQITSEYIKPCGESGHGALAGLLSDETVDVLICGGIGGGAIAALTDAGITVVGGACGNVRQVAEDYLAGKLDVNVNFMCHHHDGEHHDCSSHHGCGGHCAH